VVILRFSTAATMKMNWKTFAWLLASVLLVAAVAVSSLWSFRQAEKVAATREQTNLILNQADDLLLALKDAEIGQRGFLLTGDEAFLQPYLLVSNGIRQQLANLRQLSSLEAAKAHLDAMTPLVDAKLSDLATSIALRRNHHMQAALAQVQGGQGKQLMDSIRTEMKAFIQLQDDFIARSDVQFAANMGYLLAVIVLASVCVLLSAMAFAVMMYRGNQQRLKNLVHQETQHLLSVQQNLNQQLQQTNITLQASEEKLAVTLNSIGDGVIATDAQGRVTLLNPLAQKLTGWTQAQASGQPVDDVFRILNQQTRMPAVVPVQATLASGTIQGLANHTVLIARDGREYPIADSCAPIRDRETQVVGAVLVFRDVTAEYAVQQALLEKNEALQVVTKAAEKANQAKSEFLATMSHEIRTPMNGVIGMIDVLQQSSLNAVQMEMTNIIHDSAFALLGVINDILDFSKIEANKLETESIALSVSALVESACDNLSQMALKKNVQLSLFVDPTIPDQLLGDPGRIRQILINLINNAIKFSAGQPRAGRVALRVLLTRRQEKSVALTFHVTDNGIGIGEATRAKLFIAFIQADTSTTRQFGGTGLGLAISGQLAHLMGGDIAVQSTPGMGSDFSLHLPLALGTEASQTSPSPSLVCGLHCLVLRSADNLADDVATYLRFDQAQVTCASDLSDAQQWLVQNPGGLCVVFDHDDVNPQLAALRNVARTQPTSHWRFVSIGQGKRRRPRVDGKDLVLIDGNLLTRKALLQAVAIAAGRIPTPDWDKLALPTAPAAPPMSREAAASQGRLILIAEDNEYNQKVILQQLMLLGRTADVASNGQEALTRWQTGAYALLITDLHMPLMDGYELTAAIRAAEQGHSHMPIIAFTANALKGEAEHCKAVGMDDYLAKPVQLVQIKEILKKWQPVVNSEAFAAPVNAPIPALDVKVLVALVGDDAAVIREFLHDFGTSATQIALELRNACRSGQPLLTAAAAHKLKSAARSVGALALGECCAAMEQAGKAGDTLLLRALLAQFDQELARVEAFLQAS